MFIRFKTGESGCVRSLTNKGSFTNSFGDIRSTLSPLSAQLNAYSNSKLVLPHELGPKTTCPSILSFLDGKYSSNSLLEGSLSSFGKQQALRAIIFGKTGFILSQISKEKRTLNFRCIFFKNGGIVPSLP
jgi:hypothetical protein